MAALESAEPVTTETHRSCLVWAQIRLIEGQKSIDWRMACITSAGFA